MRFNNRREAFVFWYGAIDQLGERVLCKHEVVGSIPSGSTTLRPSGYAWRSHGMAEGRSMPAPNGRACGIFDIVKRRSIRVWDLRSISRNSNHYLRDVSAPVHRKMSGL